MPGEYNGPNPGEMGINQEPNNNPDTKKNETDKIEEYIKEKA